MLWQSSRRSGGYWFRAELGEWRAQRLSAWCPGIPLAEADEIQPRRGQDMAEMDLRLPTVARAPGAAAADPAGERALDACARR